MASKGRRITRKFLKSCSVDHRLPTISPLYKFLILCSSLRYVCCCSATDTIMFNNSISDERGETLVSANGTFQLGFFTPNESPSKARYVGIWYYNFTPQTVVWVANRVHPLSDRNGSFALTEDGKLKVLDGKGNFTWSSEFESATSSNMTANLRDSGNLVIDGGSGKTLWESFKNPTDTFLPGMKMTETLKLISWSSSNDPGNFMFQQDQNDEKQYNIVQNRSIPYWKSGISGKFITSDDMTADIIYFLSGNPLKRSSFTLTILRNKPIKSQGLYVDTRLVMNSSGQVQYYLKDKIKGRWQLIWEEPRDLCGVLNACGDYGICNSKNGSRCKCMPGFQSRYQESWKPGDFSDGCMRKTPCGEKNDTFQNLKKMKVGKPDSQFKVENETECRDECVKTCKCQAYSFEQAKAERSVSDTSNVSAQCWTWSEGLNNLWEEYTGGRGLNVRIPVADLEGSPEPPIKQPSSHKMSRSLIIAIAISSVVVLIVVSCAIVYMSYLWKRRLARREENKENIQRNQALYGSERRVKDLIDSGEFREEDKKGIDVPFFDLESILAATDNFSDANQLGRGGFGSVYKGTLPGGREIAVKRLSNVSVQGLGEFKNEVVLIAKLQHRNLVRLLGYCIKREEKILVYEFMPNKSLDSFIFDRTLCTVLNWELRFNIVLGIARGLLYLHQDSRLRIIHRDLKTSNILLDEEMNPKISDFGLARIFEGKQIEGSTNRVVGTYGYMSPEYALDGLFSIKSDVFSFGVVVLEIISGRRNTGFYQSKITLSLLGYAWKLWNEGKALDLMHETLRENCNTNEFLRCINVGLLCVQEDANDRPTMSNVVVMLGSETTLVPTPKQPAFIVRRDPSSTASSSTKPETSSNTGIVEGR